jgi:threonine dehydratase
MNAASQLSEDERQRGLITYSSGNHAQAVALAAKRFGVSAVIAMPEDAPAVKVASVRELGATIHFAGTTSPERKTVAEDIVRTTGGTMIEPFDHPHTICGQGTATLEMLEQLEQRGASISTLVVPVGGGGLLAGACLAAQGSGLRIVTVEPEGCDSMRQSLAAGELCSVNPGPTIADGLKPTTVGKLNFEIARAYQPESVTVTDSELSLALVTLLTRCRLLVEPSGAAPLAAVMAGKLEDHGEGVGMLLSGGNVAPELVAELLSRVIG